MQKVLLVVGDNAKFSGQYALQETAVYLIIIGEKNPETVAKEMGFIPEYSLVLKERTWRDDCLKIMEKVDAVCFDCDMAEIGANFIFNYFIQNQLPVLRPNNSRKPLHYQETIHLLEPFVVGKERFKHMLTVGDYCVDLCEHFDVEPDLFNAVCSAGYLHEVGYQIDESLPYLANLVFAVENRLDDVTRKLMYLCVDRFTMRAVAHEPPPVNLGAHILAAANKAANEKISPLEAYYWYETSEIYGREESD